MMFNSYRKEEINQLPLLKFEDKIILVVNEDQLQVALNEIMQHENVGFDTESKPAFKKGEYNPVALVQIAIPGKVYLIRVNVLGTLNSLKTFFESNAIQKIGVGLRDDLVDLKKLIDFEPTNFLDLSTVATTLGIKNVGVRNLAANLLEGRISKSQQTSNWEKEILTEGQMRYAATDAWVCLEIYNLLTFKGYI